MLWVHLLACGVELPVPTLTGVAPDRGWNGEPTVIAIEGEAFYPQVQLDANQPGEADLDRGFVAWLDGESGRFPLSSVSAVDYEHLRAVVDPGLPLGTYDVLVESPGRSLARLDDAFIVSDTRADRLVLSTPSITPTVNDTAAIEVALVDPNGVPVQADLEVRMRLSVPDGLPNADVALGLEGQVTNYQTFELTGNLGADGFASVPVQVFVPDTLTIEVEAIDAGAGIAGDRLVQEWLPSGLLAVQLTLPGPSWELSAGDDLPVAVKLVDEFGNTITDRPTSVTLGLSCGDTTLTIPGLVGERSVVLRPTVATDFGSPCTEQRVRVQNGPHGQSDAFVVHAGAASRYDVTPLFLQSRAGSLVAALITARDAFGNRTAFPGDITLLDTVDGLGTTSCQGTLTGDRTCTAITTVAGEQIRLIARSDHVEGTSLPYDVLPSATLGSITLGPTDVVRAGLPAEVDVEVLDPYGNVMLPSDVPAATPTTGLPDETCTRTSLPSEAMRFECTFTTARPDASLHIQAGSLDATSEPFAVLNGPASLVGVTAPGAVSAGVPFDVDLWVTDALGNPYTDPVGDPLVLVDAAGNLALPLTLVDGAATVGVTVTTAGVDRFSVAQADVLLGTSDPVVVAAGPASSLGVSILEPWGFVGRPTEVRVEARDAWGNRTPDAFAFIVSGGGPAVPGTLVNGAATVAWTWTTPELAATLSAVGAGITGVSEPLDVVADCGAGGPSAALDFAGAPTGRACSVGPDVPVPVTLSLGGSSVGLTPLSRYATRVSGVTTVSSMPTFAVDVVGSGERTVRALVVDGVLCGSETSSSIWAGPDDGAPVGPMELLGPASLGIGDVGAFTLDGAVDCTGDPAAGAEVRIRADRGDLTGVTPTGAGLVATLDPSGSATFGLDLLGASTGGPGSIWVAADSGGSAGRLDLLVTGDDLPPRVWSQDPSGDTDGLVDTVTVRFSEPILENTGGEQLQVTGPAGTSVSAVTWGDDTLTLTLDPPADADLGAWTVEVADVRDLAGNRLDGAGIGVASAWLATFGLLPPDVDPVACTADTAIFRPDGDPGAGIEADLVNVSLQSASTPAGWVATVRDATGGVLRVDRFEPLGPLDSWSWDGRGVDGAVAADGVYTLVVEADDGFGNRVDGCVINVTLDNGRDDG
ncbi:MAG: Ig-like domain-containing protein [Alphaproteobacteria bacterium]|nr:Ig-like domain-containing protein [Alphaproteobacteria bacterium]